MTTQDYIDAEIQREQNKRAESMAQSQRAQTQYGQWCQRQAQTYGGTGPSEVILLHAKVRELTDKLAAEAERCAAMAEDHDDNWPCECQHGDAIAARIRGGQ